MFVSKKCGLGMMRGFNERKAEILELLDRMGESTALDVAGALGITQINSSRLLGLYFREGLTRRRTIDRFGTKSYQITERGRKRLNWIRGGL